MDFELSEEQRALRGEVVQFAQEELNDGVLERDRDQTFSRELWRKCGTQGLTGLPVPPEYGGRGYDALTTAVALEGLGYGCRDGGLIFSVCAHLLACVVPIWKHGSEEQKRQYLPQLCDGTSIAVNAMTEPGSGSDAFAMTTRAEPEGTGYRLNGTKLFASNGPVADAALVYAMTDPDKGALGGVSAFLIDSSTEGLHVGPKLDKMGLRSSPTGELVLEDVRVSADSVLGSPGAGSAIFSRSMEWERILIAASQVGTMERLLEETVRHARTRESGGQTIGKFQAVAHKIADIKVRLEVARLLVYKAAWRLDRSRDLTMDAAITKLQVSESLVQTALDAVQLFGGHGYMTEGDVERALRDAVGSTLYSGTSEIQRNIIARWLGL